MVTTTSELKTRREAVVNAHIRAEAIDHDPDATVATFSKPRYEVPALGAIVDGAEAVRAFISQLLTAFPDLWVRQEALHHSDNAVFVEAKFGGTQRGDWAGIAPTGKAVCVDSVLVFFFEGTELVCEKVYFDHATVLRQIDAPA